MPEEPPRPDDRGPGVGLGVGIGCLAYVIGGFLMLAGLGAVGSTYGWVWPFVVIIVVAGAMMFFRRTRPIATGMLIVSAASWLVVIGPCLIMVSSY